VQAAVESIRREDGEVLGVVGDVCDRASLEKALQQITNKFGMIDILVNGAGGNKPAATTSMERSFFDLDFEAVQHVFNLNFTGALLASQVFGSGMAERGQGCIVNISSMAAIRPLTNVVSYAAAKAGLTNFTQWLAVYMAQHHGAKLRVNAIAPGFFLTEQNRFLLTDAQTGAMTPRGQAILNHTPMGRFGSPGDLIGTLLWLVSPASAFVTGTVIPVDGGFAAFGGV
jgi:NAD(P)-dependent dehydrogenase (short-subunit alcohol dehydrogenase family)